MLILVLVLVLVVSWPGSSHRGPRACARHGARGHARRGRCQLDARGRLAIAIVVTVPSWSWPGQIIGVVGAHHSSACGRGRERVHHGGWLYSGSCLGSAQSSWSTSRRSRSHGRGWVVGIRSSWRPRSHYVKIDVEVVGGWFWVCWVDGGSFSRSHRRRSSK